MGGTVFDSNDELDDQEDDPDAMPSRPDLTDEEMEALPDAVQVQWPDPEEEMNWADPNPYFPWSNRIDAIVFCQIIKRSDPIPACRNVQGALDMCKALHPEDQLPPAKHVLALPPAFP